MAVDSKGTLCYVWKFLGWVDSMFRISFVSGCIFSPFIERYTKQPLFLKCRGPFEPAALDFTPFVFIFWQILLSSKLSERGKKLKILRPLPNLPQLQQQGYISFHFGISQIKENLKGKSYINHMLAS